MVHVAVLGAAGGIGQSLSLLLKRMLPYNSILSLYDLAGTPGVAADISHVDSPTTVRYGLGSLPPIPNDPNLQKLARGVDVFVIVAGIPRKPGMTRDDLFKINAGIVLDLVKTCASVSPNAFYCIVSNPVNSTVPIAAEALRSQNAYNPNRLFGVTTLDILRATTFINEARAPYYVNTVPVIGGHSDVSIVPLFSQLPGPTLPEHQIKDLAIRVQVAGTEVVKAKAGKGSATLSMAEAGARFTLWLVDAITGRSNPLVYSYVDTQGIVSSPFFAIPVLLGKSGIERRYPLGPLSSLEEEMYQKSLQIVTENIRKGQNFARAKL